MSRLKEIRISHKYLQEDIAKILDVGRTTYVKYENGQSDLPTSAWVKLSEFYNVSVDYLLGKSNVPNANALQLSAEPSENNPFSALTVNDERVTEILSIMEKLPAKTRDEAMNYLRYLASKEET